MPILIDRALAARQAAGRPVRVALVGAGFMGRGIALQIGAFTQGMRLVAVVNRTAAKAVEAVRQAGLGEGRIVESPAGFAAAAAAGEVAVTEDPRLATASDEVDVVVEVTGSLEYAAHVATSAIDHGKHLVLVNAELDGTVGLALKRRADRAGVVCSNADGDQPGVILNLYRFVKQLGLRPVLCGNIKGLHDPYRNPTTQESFAARWGQNPRMVTSFADGTKIAFEQAIVASATRMGLLAPGMLGPTVPTGTRIEDAVSVFPVEALLAGPGAVDYIVGADPAPGVFVLGTTDHPAQRHYLELYKLGTGPLYCFHTPYHLCHFEVPATIARAALFGDAAVAPAGPPMIEVVGIAKQDLAAGTCLDGLGGYHLYGRAEEAASAAQAGLLPIGLSEGATLNRPVRRDEPIRRLDVELPRGRLIDALRAEQEAVVLAAGAAA